MKRPFQFSHSWKSLTVAGTLALAGFGFAYAQTGGWALSEHQRGIPGPVKLTMAEADYSGRVNTDPQFIADRQAIINHVTAYSYLIDEGRWEQWYSLFSDDVEFATTVPCIGSITLRGKASFRPFADERYGARTTAMRRHTMGNVHVASQTPTTAQVRTYMLISSVPAADQLKVVATGTYNATLEKREGRWIITRWYIEVDNPLAPSAMPPGIDPSTVTFIPDARAACQPAQ